MLQNLLIQNLFTMNTLEITNLKGIDVGRHHCCRCYLGREKKIGQQLTSPSTIWETIKYYCGCILAQGPFSFLKWRIEVGIH